MRIISYIFLLLVMLIGITFASLNAAPVPFHYYLGSQQIPLALLLIFAFGCGILVGVIFILFSIIKLKRDNYRLKGHIKIVEKELENLRSLPLKGE
jgi:lipopolysaccharide assembly protein A